MAEQSLARILVDRRLVTDDQMQSALEEQARSGRPLAEILVEQQVITAERLLEVVAAQTGMGTVDLDRQTIPPEVLARVPAAMARLHTLVPVAFDRNVLTVALGDPTNLLGLDELRVALGCQIKGVVAAESQVREAIQRHYGAEQASLGDAIQAVGKTLSATGGEGTMAAADASHLRELATQAPVVHLLNALLLDAVTKRASDVHFEPFEHEFKIRYRIDGSCVEIAQPPKTLSLAVTSRLKVMANLDVAESRLPQDGRILLHVEGRQVDLRVSTLPTVFGESVVLRVLDKGQVQLSLDQLGMPPKLREQLEQLITLPNGILLVTGPTGSGKTTTLYSCLRQLNRTDAKVITTEDPVEYDIAGLIQVPVNLKIKLDFATCLRAILRQDPDIIMVGEIRDGETAQTAVQASLTGHLVLSTLHTNDAPGAITRLIDMGVEPFLLVSTLRAVLAQRLVRKICTDCREPHAPTEEERHELGLGAAVPCFRGRGCARCYQSGYRGRLGLYEYFPMSEALCPLVLDRVSVDELRRVARDEGMRTLREDGLEKIEQGITTVEEILKETQAYA